MEEYTRELLKLKLEELEYSIKKARDRISDLENTLRHAEDALDRDMSRADAVRKDLESS